MDNWTADIDTEMLTNGSYAPVLVLTPPAQLGPPVRLKLEGEFPHAELARFAALDALAAMTR